MVHADVRYKSDMKTLAVSLCCVVLIVSVGFAPGTLAQQQSTQSATTQPATVTEIVESLNKTGFPLARIGLEFDAGEAYRSNDSMDSMNLMLSRLSESAYFSSGFTVDSLDGCSLKLKNDQVKILKWYSGSYDQHFMSLSKFLMAGRKGEKQLTPQSGVLSVPLNKLKYKGSTTPKYIKDPKSANVIGTWKTEFEEKGFFRRNVIEMEVSAAEGIDLKSKMTARNLFFMFDDKTEAENFNIAFRRAIQLCANK